MKKKLLLLPLLLLSLSACSVSVSDDESGDQTPSSTEPAENVTVTSIEVTEKPKTTYLVGESFSLAGIVVTATYSNGKKDSIQDYEIDLENNHVFTEQEIGEKVVNITYKDDSSIKTSFTITISAVPAEIDGISIKNKPNKKVYSVDGYLDLTGLQVEAHYSDGTTSLITSGYTTSVDESYQFVEADVGEFTITVTYGTFEDSFTVTVNPSFDPLTLESIEITSTPNKVSYLVGEAFSLDGLVITATYTVGGDVVLDPSDYTSSLQDGYVFETEDAGVINKVTITFGDFDDEFNILVTIPHVLSIEEKCDEMNNILPSSITNPFEVRDYLLTHDFEYVVDEQEDSEFFGYDYQDNKVVIYSMSGANLRTARYPTTSVGHEVVSFRSTNISTAVELSEAIINVNVGLYNYSTLKLTSNVEVDGTLVVSFASPIEFDLGDYVVSSSVAKDVFRVNHDDAVVNFKAADTDNNGTPGKIKTIVDNDTKDLGSQDAPACISAMSFKSITLNNVALDCRARYGYGIIDSIYANDDSKIAINNCNSIYAETNALCVLKSTVSVNHSYINGIVNISGGHVDIDDTTITAVGRHDDAEDLVSDEWVSTIATYLYDNNYGKYGFYTVSATDPIIIFDRRNRYDLLDNPVVTIKDSTLVADYDSGHVYGYGIRYIDLALGTKTTRGSVNLVGDVNFYCCQTSTNPHGIAGGYNVSLPE